MKNENKETCNHPVLITKGYNEGLPVQIDYDCVCCGKHLSGKKRIVSTKDRFVYHQMYGNKVGAKILKEVVKELRKMHLTDEELVIGVTSLENEIIESANRKEKPTSNELQDWVKPAMKRKIRIK